jgi:hypothetical protein
MGWATAFRWRERQERRAATSCRAEVRSQPTLDLERTRYAAGELVAARLSGVAGPAAVGLLRLERRPCGVRPAVVADRHGVEAPGRFELTIPPGALPTARGAACALSYFLQANAGGAIARAELEVAGEARVHVEGGVRWTDRLLPEWQARHFHIELTDAALHGGGFIAGRVHRHGSWRTGRMTVVARCFECWRSPAYPVRGIPQWRESKLWEAEQPLIPDPDATWAPFAIELPSRLPPAVEAPTISWRYELFAILRVRHRFAETAALTPLLHEDRGRELEPASCTGASRREAFLGIQVLIPPDDATRQVAGPFRFRCRARLANSIRPDRLGRRPSSIV